jgi:guanosine-3',5'-bis(diphosphate) 3'-pyrophosphohydrolase
MATPAELQRSAAGVPPRPVEDSEADAQATYTRLRKLASKSCTSDELEHLDEAYLFAKARHGDQRRADGRLYITHPVEVAEILVQQGLDAVSLISALLHDVVEDTTPSKEEAQKLLDEIRAKFGADVARCVDGVTKIRKLEFYSREERQAESVRKMLLAMVSDVRVILVKFGDRIHNLQTLGAMPPDKRARTAQETLDVYCPIAHRLGMGKVRAQMEDLAFQHLDPDAYREIVGKVANNRNASEDFLHQIKQEVEEKLKAAGVEARVEARLKRPYSVWQKIKRQKIGIEQVYDLLALRIITRSVRDCYSALGIMHAEWTPIFGRIKDFIALPRPNLYQSLHTSVIVPGGQMFEVQIRTEEMHRIAEEGIAAHWKYKEGKRGPVAEDQRIAWLRQLVDWQKEMGAADFMNAVQKEFHQEDVFVFSPQGRVIVLPNGATPVDFAYAIHTDVGNTCSGAKVNGRIIPLKQPLQNGDVVEILTQPGTKPNRDWLAFVKTSKALSKIRHFVSTQERASAIEIGRKFLESEARRLGVALSKVSKAKLDEVTGSYGVARMEDLYAALGFGRYSARQVLSKLAPDEVQLEETPAPGRPAKAAKAPADSHAIQVKGADQMLTFRSKCCNPILGEPIVGYVTRGKGVAVHSVVCQNVASLMYDAERKIDVEWARSSNESFVVKLQIHTDDRPGMLNQFTSILAHESCNIRSLEAHTDHRSREEEALVDMTIEIRDKKQLDKLMAQLRRVSGVRDVVRRS